MNVIASKPASRSMDLAGESTPAHPAAEDAPIFVLNCGSSSIKFAWFDGRGASPPRAPTWSGQVEGIGGRNPRLLVAGRAPIALTLGRDRPYQAALQAVRTFVQEQAGGRLPSAVAHRVVHGGSAYAAPVRVDREVLEKLERYIPLAPLHQPLALEAIRVLLDQAPSLPQVACFDTAFHRTLPQVEQMMALPHALWERGTRRYGFHGLSYEYISVALAEHYGDWARGRTIVAHLGSGASLCAMRELQSVATTMGFSALDGLMIGTRCGALDPGVVLHLIGRERYSPERLEHLLYHESGLLGVSGLSASPKVLLEPEDSHLPARLALDLYVRRIVREIGALTAVLGGLDMLVFTAGVGENSAPLRARICLALGWLRLEIDADANRAGLRTLSTAASRVCVVVEPTNEEWIAATHAQRLIGGRAAAGAAAPPFARAGANQAA